MDNKEFSIKSTSRGFILIKFKDLYNNECSLQESSLANEDAVWFGVGDNRMHLGRREVELLLPFLQKFVEAGVLFEGEVEG